MSDANKIPLEERVRRSEEALRSTTEQLRIVADSMAAIVSRCSRDLKYLWVSKPYADWLQHPAEEIIGRPIVEIIGTKAFDHLRPHFEEVLAGQIVRYEEQVHLNGLGPRWINAVYTPTLDGAGMPDGWVGVVIDVDERKRLEDALRASGERLAGELDAITRLHALNTRLLAADNLRTALDDVLENVIAACGADFGNVQLHNPDLKALEIVAHRGFRQDFLDYFRQVRMDAGSSCAQAMASGERVIIEDVELDPEYAPHRHMAASAGYRAVQSTPLKNREGTVFGILSTHFRLPQRVSQQSERLLDVYARHAADVILRFRYEEDLRKRQEILHLIHQIAKIGHWEWNSLTNENKWSPEIQALYGLEPGTFEGTYDAWAKHIHPDDLPAAEEAVRRAMETGMYFTEFRVIWPDGSVHWLEARAKVFKDGHEKPLGIMGVNMDVTERKRQEEELREADRKKDVFLATLAHELRNPLAPIRNAVQFLNMKEPVDPELQNARDIIDRQVRQMVRLVDDLLDVSRISRGKINLQKERTILSLIVTNAIEASRPLIEASRHELTLTLPPETIYVEADTTRLTQVFSNLLNNAAKYMQQGGRIGLTAERQGSDVVVTVKDTGIGISADKLPALFEMFSQVEGSLGRSQGGLGIGLHVVKRLVEMHGGSVTARSDGPGQGSEFAVRLPVLVEASEASLLGKEDEGTVPKSSLRILIVDDNRDAADSLGMMLRLMGNDIRTAYDGEEAVTAAAEFRPDVVLLDIGLPKRNGYEVCRQIRQQPWSKGMVLIAVTGWGQEEDRRRSHEVGFDKHLVKPLEPRSLMNLLRELQSVRAW